MGRAGSVLCHHRHPSCQVRIFVCCHVAPAYDIHDVILPAAISDTVQLCLTPLLPVISCELCLFSLLFLKMASLVFLKDMLRIEINKAIQILQRHDRRLREALTASCWGASNWKFTLAKTVKYMIHEKAFLSEDASTILSFYMEQF